MAGKPGQQRKFKGAIALMRHVERRLEIKHNKPPRSVCADPLELMLTLVAGGWPDDIIENTVAGSKNDAKTTAVPLDIRMEAAAIAIRYIRPQLAAVETKEVKSGPDGATLASRDIAEMMRIPEMRKQIEQLSIALANQPKRLASPDTIDLTVKDAEFEEISNGATPYTGSDSDSLG